MGNSLNTSKIKKVSKKSGKAIEINKKQIANDVKKSNYELMCRRYELAYNKLYNELPQWKAIDFKKNKINNALYDEFIKSVIELAEDVDTEIFLTV